LADKLPCAQPPGWVFLGGEAMSEDLPFNVVRSYGTDEPP
jgi:hypothetical protein